MADSTLAPSEKHLEDWIVANPHLFVPNWWLLSTSEGRHYAPLIEYIISRQTKLSRGIADLIVNTPAGVAVVELKKGTIDTDAIVQVLRYMADLEEIRIFVDIEMRATIPEFQYHLPLEDDIWGYVCGHSIFEKKVLSVCHALRITPVLYTYQCGTYEFDTPADVRPPQVIDVACDFSHGAIGDAMKHSALAKYRRFLERKKSGE
jgi:hypothetical protein